MPYSVDEFVKKYSTTGKTQSAGGATSAGNSSSGRMSVDSFINRYATIKPQTVQKPTEVLRRPASAPSIPKEEQRRQSEREAAAANRTQARQDYADILIRRDNLRSQAEEMQADYDQRIANGEKEEDLAEQYAQIIARLEKAKAYDLQADEAYKALKQSSQDYKEVYADYNAARKELKEAENTYNSAERSMAYNAGERQKEAGERLANARKAFEEQGGDPDADWLKANLQQWGAGMLGTLRYGQELNRPENAIKLGPITIGGGDDRMPAEMRAAIEEKQKADYEEKHGAGTWKPAYQRTEETAARMQREAAEDLSSIKAGRSELAQLGIDVAGQSVQMGLDAVFNIGGVIPSGSLTSMALRTFGASAQEAKDAGATLGQQGLYGAGSAAVEVLTEKMFDGVAKIYGAGAADDLVSHMIGKFADNRLGRAALQWAADALGEGFEEVVSDLANPFLRSIYDKDVANGLYTGSFADRWRGYWGQIDPAEVGYDFLVGAAMGFAGGSVENVANALGITATDERSKFFMDAGQSGMSFKDAMNTWRKHLIKTGYATKTSDQKITNQANEYLNRLDNGKRVSERKINKLNERALNAITNEDIANTKSAVQGRLHELGVDDERLAQAVAAIALEDEAERIGAKGFFATDEQRAMVENSKEAKRVLFEMDVENLRGERRAEIDAYVKSRMDGATKDDYTRAVEPYARTNEWVKTMQQNKALATDVYGTKASVSEAEKTAQVSFANKKGNTVNGQIVGINKDGTLRIKHGKDGKLIQNVAIDQVTGISENYRVLLEAAAERENGNVMLQAYRPGQDIFTYLQQWDLAENVYGPGNYSAEKARSVYSLRDLTDTQLELALEQGRQAAQNRQQQGKATQEKLTGELGFWQGGKIDGVEYDGVTAEEAKKLLGEAEYGFAADVLAKVVNVTLIKSREVNGNYRGAQGIFYRNGHIYLDVNAGMNSAKDVGQRTIVLTAAHELTHYIKENNKEAYKTLESFITDELTRQGKSLENLVEQKQRRANFSLEPEEAMEEVIADACEMMLTDAEQIAAFASEHTAEAHTIWGWLDKFFGKIENAFKGLTARHEEAKAMQGRITELRKMWLEALAGANENALASQASDPTDTITEAKNETGFTEMIESDGQVKLSTRTYEEGGRENLTEYLDRQVATNVLTQEQADSIIAELDEKYKICKEFDNGKYAPFSAWSNAQVVSIDGRPVFSVVKQNGEYKLNLDFSLVCKKRRTLDAVFNEMIRRGIMNDFRMGQGSIAKINEIIRDHGFEVACGLCFVDSKRYRQAMIADAFCKMYNMQVFSLMKGTGAKVDSFNYGGDATIVNSGVGIDTLSDDKLNWDKVNEILRTEKKGTVKYKIAEYLKNNPQARKLVSRGDFMSTAGFDALKVNNPELLSLYNSKKGAGGPKAAQSDVQYLNEIIQQGQFNEKAAYEVGGVRIQSFSDYVGRLVFDYVQMVADLSAKKLPAHSYTKEFMFAQQFGLTGIKINMSLVPEVVKGVDKDHAGLDKNGNYTWKDGQSFGSTVYDNNGKRLTAAEGFQLAIKIQNAEGYSKNCGTIAVGVSRAHIEKMLDDPEIRMIIPYHKSGLNHLVAAMNQIDKYTDYTNVQNTREYKNGKWSRIPAAKEFNWNETLQRMQAEGKGAREAAKAYLDWCNENGYKAKFDEFAGHPNYYKLLEDFSCYDKDGKTSTPLGAVQMNFPTETDAFGSMKDLIEAGLEEDAMLQAKQEGGVDDIVDEIQSALPEWEAAHPEGKKGKHADRDYSYDSLVNQKPIAVTEFEAQPVPTVKKKKGVYPDSSALKKSVQSQTEKLSNPPAGDQYYFYMPGIGGNVYYNTDSVNHGILKKVTNSSTMTTAEVTAEIPRILQNSIPINEIRSRTKKDGEVSYVTIGVARRSDGKAYVVRSTINHFADNRSIVADIEIHDYLKGIKAKNIDASALRSLTVTTAASPSMNGNASTVINIADVLDFVKDTYPEYLSDSVREHYGIADNPKESGLLYSLRDTPTVQKTKEHYQERLDKLRAEKNAKIEQIRKEETQRRQAAVKKEKAAKWEKVEETKERYRGMMENQRNKRSDTAVRGKIKKLHKELSDILLKPKEGRYVPRDLVKATAEILGAVDTTSGRAVKAKAALAELKVQYDALADDQNNKYALAYDETISGMLQKLAENIGDGSIYDLTGGELESVYNVLKALKHTIVTANKLVGSKIEADAFEAANQMMNETQNAKAIPNKLLRKFVLTQFTPSSAFRMFGGYKKNSMWEQMFNELNNGQLTQTQILMEGGQIFRELIDDKKNLDKLHDRKNLVDIGLKDDQGNAIKVTRGMMLSVYMHLLNEQNARHVAYGGLTVPRLVQYYKNQMKDAYKGETGRAVAFADEISNLNKQLENAETVEEQEAIKEKLAELNEKTDAYMSNLRAQIEEQLTDYDRKWIAAAQEFFDVYSKGKLNEVTEMVYGFEKAQVDHYFPIHTDPDYRAASFDTITRDMSLENAGFMKERVNSAKPILLEDITDVISSQLRRTAQYCGLMPVIRNFNKAYGKARDGYSMSVQSALSRKFEGEGQKYIENLMADLNGARKTEANIFDELRGNMAGAVLTLNPRVAMAQAASYPTAASEIGYKPLIKALKDIKNNPNWNEVARDEVAKWTPLWWYRMQGFSTVELGDIKNNEQALSKVLQKMKWATGWIQFMDGATTGALWQASKYYVDENFTDLKKGSDEYMMKVAETYNRVLEKTQPDYTTMQRPDILRNPNAIVKQLTMFMTQRLQNTNILYDAAATYSHYVRDLDAGRNGVTAADVKQAKTRLVWAVSSQVAAGATNVIFKAIADALMHNLKAYRDDDDELTAESISKTMLTNFAETLTSNVLWGSELFAALKSVVTGDRYYGISLNGVDTFKDILEDGVKTLSKAWKGDWEGFKAPAWKLSKAVAQFFGIPLGNAEKVGKMTANWFEDARNGTWYEADVDRTKAQNTHLLFNALQSGDTKKAERIRAEFKDEKDARSALKGYIQELYIDPNKGDKMQKAEVVNLLQQYAGMTKREAEDTAQKWTMEVVTGYKFSSLQDDYISGEIPKAKAVKFYQTYSSNGRTTQAEAEAAVQKWTCEKETGIAYDNIDTEVKTGRLSKDKAIQMVMKYGGKDEDAATKTVNGYLIEHEYDITPNELEDEYMAGRVDDDEAMDILLRYRYYGKEEAEKKATEELERMRFVKANPDAEDISVTQVRNYQAAGLEGIVSASVYADAAKMMGTFHGVDADDDGKTDRYSIIIQKLEYIDTLDLTPEQKTRLAQALGISDKNIRRRAPWR